MREAFRKAVGENFISQGGKELMLTAQVEENPTDFYSVEDLLALLSAASERENAPENIRKAFHEASVSPIGENGKPRMLKLTAWIAHGGYPNRNRDMFVAEDLKAVVDGGLFAPPYMGMVDYNHDFNLYGSWFKARYEYDPVAEAYGILAEGAIFAWRFPELADRMLAMQSRLGHIDVSMACMPGDVDFAEDELGTYAILRSPTFFTTSVLDVDPADASARALGTEDVTQTTLEREQELMLASAQSDNFELTEVDMKVEELIEAFRAVVAEENQSQFAPLVEAATRLPEVEEMLAAKETEVEVVTAKVTTLEETVATMETAAAESELALTTARAEIETKDAELEALRAFKASVDEEKATAEKAERRAAILASFSEAGKTAFEAMTEEKQEKMLARWEAIEDEDELEVVLAGLRAKVEPKGQYETASDKEGILAPVAEKPSKGKLAMDDFIS